MPYVLNSNGMNKCIGCLTCMLVCSVVNQDGFSFDKCAVRIRPNGCVTANFIAIVCRGCTAPACREVCPVGALEMRHGGGVLLNEDRCIGCRRCESACSVCAVKFNEVTQKPIICTHCGVCTTFCTHDCLMMEEVGGGDGSDS